MHVTSLLKNTNTCFLFWQPICPFCEAIGWETSVSNEFWERDPNSERENFAKKQLQFLKSERERHNPERWYCCSCAAYSALSHPLPNLLQGVSYFDLLQILQTQA